MASEYVYLYPDTYDEAVRQGEEELWEQSFRENVCCARTIEKALRQDESFAPDCAGQVLKEFGHKRVSFVLAQTVQELKEIPVYREMFDRDVSAWAKEHRAPADKTYGRYYCVNAAIVLLNRFIHQTQAAYQALGLFGGEHCAAGMYDGNVKGKVLVMRPSTLKESCWSPENQLWLATGGFGCDPKASGRAIYATCLGDGEQTRWNRNDFFGVLDERFLPEWAQEKLEALRTLEQCATTLGGMKMG